jgi:hypothetical protein
MGIWETNNDSFKVNIGQEWIGELKNKGCKFCWRKDNENVLIAFDKYTQKEPDKKEDKSDGKEDKSDGKEDKSDGKEDKQEHILEVITSDGDTVRGKIVHMVNGRCSGALISDWFIICPGE